MATKSGTGMKHKSDRKSRGRTSISGNPGGSRSPDESNPRATRQMSSMLQSSAFGWQYTQKPFSPFQQWEW